MIARAPWAVARRARPTWLLLLLLLTSVRLGDSQQLSPLQGQGVDPVTDGTVDKPVPVYLSVLLRKVLNVDEQLYRFDAALDAILTWDDPRVDDAFSQISSSTLATNELRLRANKLCADAIAVNATNAEELCLKAADSSKGSGCSKPCSINSVGFCCDAIWLPAVVLDNVFGYSQDRFIDENIIVDTGTVWREAHIEGTFTNTFDFKSFPFDTQELKISFHCLNPAVCYLNSSYVGKQLPLLGSRGSSKKTFGQTAVVADEVKGWTINEVDLSCAVPNLTATGRTDSGVQATWQPFNPDDPWYGVDPTATPSPPPPPLAMTAENLGTICDLTISITRMSYYYAWMDLFPSLLITVMAFAVYFTDPEAIDIRLATVVTLFLALVAVQFIIVDQLPQTSYLTDFLACIVASYVILFAILVESVVVYMIIQHSSFHKIRFGGKRKCCSQHQGQGGLHLYSRYNQDDSTVRRDAEEAMKFLEAHEEENQAGKVREELTTLDKKTDNPGEADGDKADGLNKGKVTTDVLDNSAPQGSLEEAQGGHNDGSWPGEIGKQVVAEDSARLSGVPKETSPRATQTSWVATKKSLAHEPMLGHVIAWYVDIISGPLIFLAYVVAIVVIFCSNG